MLYHTQINEKVIYQTLREQSFEQKDQFKILNNKCEKMNSR